MRITILVFLLVFAMSVSGQSKKASLANTTWIISHRLCSDKENLGSETIQLLPNGKINSFVDGNWIASEYGSWRLTGSRLRMGDNNELFIRSFDVTLKGKVGTGIGWSPLAKSFCVRMTKQ